jgi:hypothetical protein
MPTGMPRRRALATPSSRTSRARQPPRPVLVDDQTVSALLRGERRWPRRAVFTTGHWYLRLCQAVVRGVGGQLSGPVLALPPVQRERVLEAILELPERIDIMSWTRVAPVMASQLAGPGHGLNLLAREALAAATILNAEVVIAPGNESPSLTAALRSAGLS